MKKVLVTGAGGMAGSHMCDYFCNSGGYRVTGTYYRPTTDIRDIHRDVELIECDVRYPSFLEKIISDRKPDYIFHLAAQSYPTVSWVRPYETVDININGTVAVFEAVRRIRSDYDSSYDPMVVVACSSAEYGETLNELKGDEIFVTEDAPLKPLHPYGVSKVAQDLLSFQYFMNNHIRCIRARIFNSTGTRKTNDVTSDFTYRAVLAEMDGSYRISVGNLETRRAIMDQRDLVSALVLLAEKGKSGEVYNISSENIYQMRDIVSMIENVIGHRIKTVVDQKLMRSTDEKVIAGDVSRLKKDTGWVQNISMEQTVSDMINWWRKKMNG